MNDEISENKEENKNSISSQEETTATQNDLKMRKRIQERYPCFFSNLPTIIAVISLIVSIEGFRLNWEKSESEKKIVLIATTYDRNGNAFVLRPQVAGQFLQKIRPYYPSCFGTGKGTDIDESKILEENGWLPKLHNGGKYLYLPSGAFYDYFMKSMKTFKKKPSGTTNEGGFGNMGLIPIIIESDYTTNGEAYVDRSLYILKYTTG